jgi:photosystem II stability/assembly factor-like uncharacterized protein
MMSIHKQISHLIHFIAIPFAFGILECSTLQAQWKSENYGVKRLRDVQFFSSGQGYIVGENGFMLKLSNWGESQEPITNLPFNPEFLGGLCFVNEDSGWVVGSDGAVFKTIDAGLNWENHDQGFVSFLACHSFTVDILWYAWVCGTDSTIFSTRRGGMEVWMATR